MKEDYRVIDATFAVAKRKPEKIQACAGFEPRPLRYRFRIPYKPEFFQAFFSQLQKLRL